MDHFNIEETLVGGHDSPFKGALTHPKKVTKNCQVCDFFAVYHGKSEYICTFSEHRRIKSKQHFHFVEYVELFMLELDGDTQNSSRPMRSLLPLKSFISNHKEGEKEPGHPAFPCAKWSESLKITGAYPSEVILNIMFGDSTNPYRL